MTSVAPESVVEVQNLTKIYKESVRDGGGPVTAVDDVSLTVTRGQSLALVGESGSGKSTLARCVLGLTRPTSGRIYVCGSEVTGQSERTMRSTRRKIQIIFQDPRASFDPRMPIARSLTEPLRVHGVGDRSTRLEAVSRMLDLVGLDTEALKKHPHEFSGGQLQRLAIARALVLEPEVLVCDEPVSALDVSIQAQILALLRELQARLSVSYLFIAHDLGVVREISHEVAVILDGRIVERETTTELLERPQHPYTRTLIEASLSPSLERRSKQSN